MVHGLCVVWVGLGKEDSHTYYFPLTFIAGKHDGYEGKGKEKGIGEGRKGEKEGQGRMGEEKKGEKGRGRDK